MDINGSSGDDALDGSTGPDLILAFAGNDTVRGGAGNDALFGGNGNDLVYGGNGSDRLFGGAGNDTLDGGLAPGESTDGLGRPWDAAIYDFSAWTTSVTFPDYPVGFNPIKFPSNQLPDGQGGMDTLVNIAALEIYGGSAPDILAGSPLRDGIGSFVLIEGNGGDDRIEALYSTTTIGFDTARRDLGVDRISSFNYQDRILLRNFDFDLSQGLSIGDGTTLAQGQVQFGAYDAASNLTRVYVGADATVGADLVFDLYGQFQLSQFSRNDAGGDAYLVMDDGRSDPVQPPAPPQTYQGTTGNDEFTGGSGNDTIAGGDGADVLAGSAGDDRISGDGGNDHLNGGAGNDHLDGGTGFDAASYDFTAMSTGVSFTGTLNPVAASSAQADGLGGIDTLVGIDSLEIFGGGGADTLVGSAAHDFLEGGAGNDLLSGGANPDTFGFETTRTDLGIDTITDFAAGDRILLRHFAMDFSQPISTGDGSAVTQGQVQFGYDAASNTTSVFVGTDAAAGADLTIALQGRYDPAHFSRGAVFTGDTYSELVYTPPPVAPPPPPATDPARTFNGTAAADTFTGGSGNDSLSGAAGNDTLAGEGGDDFIFGDAGNDRLLGGDGQDTVHGGLGRDRLEGGGGHDALVGGDGDDMIWGDEGADWIQGDAGNDRLTGGAGDDFLVGGTGADTLVGNAGADTFFFDAGSGSDRIDFFWMSHNDRIRIQSNVNGSGILSAQDAYAATTDTADGALVNLGGGHSVLLVGVHLDAINAGIFEVV